MIQCTRINEAGYWDTGMLVLGGKIKGLWEDSTQTPCPPLSSLQDCKDKTTDICNVHNLTDTDWDYISLGDQIK
jgi:hypothetical protein